VLRWIGKSDEKGKLNFNKFGGGGEGGKILPLKTGVFSFQLFTTSSHVMSVRILYSVGSLGLLEPKRNPRCLKLTMSPAFGVSLFKNSAVPGGPMKVTPFGLQKKERGVSGTVRAGVVVTIRIRIDGLRGNEGFGLRHP